MWIIYHEGDDAIMFKTNSEIIRIEAKSMKKIDTGVVFWSHDRGTAKLMFKLVKDSIPQSLPEGTTVPIRLLFKSATAEGGYGKHDYIATIEDRVNGIVSIVLEDNILGYVGIVEGSIYIDYPNGQSLDTAGRFSFAIKRSSIDETTPELKDYYFSGFERINAQFVELIKKVDEAQKSIKETASVVEASVNKAKADATNTINQLVDEAKSTVNKVASSATSSVEESAESAKTTIQAAADEVTQVINANNVYTKAEVDTNFVNLNEPQSIDGVKNFLQTPMVNQVPVLVDNALPFEAWYVQAKEVRPASPKSRLPIGREVTTIGKQKGREMKDNPLEWNSGQWDAQVLRDCILILEGSIVLEFGGAAGLWTYIDVWNDTEQTKTIGEGSGVGIGDPSKLWYRHRVHFSRYVELKEGTQLSIGTSMPDGKQLTKAKVETFHIMEIEK